MYRLCCLVQNGVFRWQIWKIIYPVHDHPTQRPPCRHPPRHPTSAFVTFSMKYNHRTSTIFEKRSLRSRISIATPNQEIQVFCNSGWRITGQRQVLRIDCLPILKPLPILPKNREEQRDVQCSDGDCNQSHEIS